MTIAPGSEVDANDILAIQTTANTSLTTAQDAQSTADAAIDAIASMTMGVTKIDRSGVIALGGQAQTLMTANASRKGWSFQNKATANMWFNDLGSPADPAASNSTYLPPGAYYESEYGGASVAAISLIGDVTGAQFVAKEW